MPLDTIVAVEEMQGRMLPVEFSLNQNYPNPFNPETSISYTLNTAGFASLKVFNTQGEEVAVLFAGQKTAGKYSVNFNARGLSSGVYFYTLKLNGFNQTRKMVLMK